MSILSRPYFHDENAAFEHLEQVLWGNEPNCPHCGTIGRATKLQGSATRLGLWKCNECRKQFTVKVGTVFEHGRMPLHKMLQAVYLIISSKKASARTNCIASWKFNTSPHGSWLTVFAKRCGRGSLARSVGQARPLSLTRRMSERNKHRSKRDKRNIGGMGKEPVFALVERCGRVRSQHVADVTAKTLGTILSKQLDMASKTMSDDGGARIGRHLPQHEFVNHSIGE
ncbi:MAG: IS1595 family transposase [Hyphomicrobiales bacterium]|nr:IS1595 family transposase [Hyphomicrobiales bacterium]